MAHDIEWQEAFADAHLQDNAMYYAKNPLIRWIHRLRVKKIIETVLELRPKKIIEIASGDGFILQELAGIEFKPEIHGTDISLKRLKRSTEKSNAALAQSDALRLPYKDNSFDLVIASEILEHIPEYENAVNEIKRITKSKGHIIISCPNELNLTVSRALLLKKPAKFPDHANSFRPDDFDRFFGKPVARKNVPGLPFIFSLNFIACYRKE